MTCNYCGSNWSKDISTKELKAELRERKAAAEQAWTEYQDHVYPTSGRDMWLMILSFSVALIGTGVSIELLPPSFWLYWGVYEGLVSTVLAAGIFFILFSPGIYWLRKDARVRADFRKEYPEAVEAVTSY